MNKGTYKRKLRKQKIWGLTMFIVGTLGSILAANWFVAIVTYPVAAFLLYTKEIIMEV